jgi:hypothetical protein
MELEIIGKDDLKLFHDPEYHKPPSEKLTWEEDGKPKYLFVNRLSDGRCLVYLGKKFVFKEEDVKMVNQLLQDWSVARRKDRMLNVDYFVLTWKRKHKMEILDD